MAEEQVLTEEQKTEEVVHDKVSASLAEMVFGDTTQTVPDVKEEHPEQVQQVTTDIKETKEETQSEKEVAFDENGYLKNSFGWDNKEAAISELKELRELKVKKNDSISFKNEESRKVHELIQEGRLKEVKDILETQDKIETLISAEVNKDTASEIIKLKMQLQYKDYGLTAQEIENKYNKEFGIPKVPVKKEFESDEEYSERYSEWQEKVNDIEMTKIIEAKLARPELEKLKSQISFPEIKKENETYQPTQDELEKFENDKRSFLDVSQKTINEFNGFNVQIKDKDVNYAVNYAPSQEEKTLIDNKLKQFAESGFNTNSLLYDRWVNEDKSLNVNQMVKDLSRIYMGEKAEQKLAFDSANKRLDAYLKEKSNIKMEIGNPQGTFNPDNKNLSEMDRLREAMLSLQ